MMKNSGLSKWVTVVTLASLLVCGRVCRSQSISEIVVFDASQSNPGGSPGLIWPEWLSSRYGISTPTENGTAFWVTFLSELEPAVTGYLNDRSPTNESLIIVGTLGPSPGMTTEEYWLEIESQLRRLADAGATSFVVNRNTYLGYTELFEGIRDQIEDVNAAGDEFLPRLADELNVSIDRPTADGFAGFVDVLDDPNRFGFTNVTDFAETGVANPHQYVWWNDGHLTTAAHRVLANDVFQTLGREHATQPFLLKGNHDTYQQDFDGLERVSDPLPKGWASEFDGTVYTTITGIFSPRIPVGGAIEVSLSPSDRALLVGVTDATQQNDLLFQARVVEEDLSQFRLMFDLEAWAMNPLLASDIGEASFDVTIEADTGEGYETVLDLGTVSTGPTLLKPRSGRLDGNDDTNRVDFDSGFYHLDLPEDAVFRVRFSATENGQIEHVTFGIDNVQLHAVPEPSGIALLTLAMIFVLAVRCQRPEP